MNRVALGSSQCPACAVFAPIAIEGYAIVPGVVVENRPGGKSAGPSGDVAPGRWSCRLLCERWSNWFGRLGMRGLLRGERFQSSEQAHSTAGGLIKGHERGRVGQQKTRSGRGSHVLRKRVSCFTRPVSAG